MLTARVDDLALPGGGTRVAEWYDEVVRLTEWYRHEPARFAEPAGRHCVELQDAKHSNDLPRLRALAPADHLSLITPTKTREHVQAVLADMVRERVAVKAADRARYRPAWPN